MKNRLSILLVTFAGILMLLISAVPHHHHNNGMLHFGMGREHRHACDDQDGHHNDKSGNGSESGGCVVHSIFIAEQDYSGSKFRISAPVDFNQNLLFLITFVRISLIPEVNPVKSAGSGAFAFQYTPPQTGPTNGLRAPPFPVI